MKTKTEPKYRVIKHIKGEHIFYREQYTNRIAVADQSCIDRGGNILPPTHQDDMSHGVLYIDFSRINKWEIKPISLTDSWAWFLPVVGSNNKKYDVLICKKELSWLRSYF